MIRIDSVKLKLPTDAILGYSDMLKHTQELEVGMVTKVVKSSTNKMSQLGLKKVTITQNSKNISGSTT